MLKHGNTVIKEVYHGSTKIGEIYHGSTLVYQSSKYDIDEVVYESSTAGTVSFNLLEKGKYEVYCIAGGGGRSVTKNFRFGGGSGSGFIGIIEMTKGTLSLVVGNGGGFEEAGGNSTIGEYVTAYGANVLQGGATPSIIATIISTTLNTAGNHGGYDAGASVYQSYGRGSDSTTNNAQAGYIKIIFKGKH